MKKLLTSVQFVAAGRINRPVHHLKLNSILMVIFLLFFGSVLPAQEEDWIRVYGDKISNVVFDLIETYDHGYVICGTQYKNGGTTIDYGLLIKTDINGEVLWEKKIGANPSPGKTGGSYLKQTPDGGYIVTGSTYIYDIYYDAFVLKLDACGEKEWSKIFYNPGSPEYGVGVEVMDDGNYIMMVKYWGNDLANDRIWLFKISQGGEIIWQKVYAKWTLGTNSEEGYNLTKNDNNEYLITGIYYQYNPGEDTNARYERPMFIKIDSTGNEMWHLLWGVNEYFYGSASKSVFNSNGDIYGVGQNDNAGIPGGYAGAMFKLDGDGNQIFSKNVPDSTKRGISTTVSLMQDSILFVGTSWADWNNNNHTTVYKTDTMGNILKEKELLQEPNTFNSSIITHDNKYLVAGSFVVDGNWDIYLWKFNKDLEFDSIYTQPFVYDSLCPEGIVSDTIDLDTTTVNLPELYEQMHKIKVHPNPANENVIITLGDLATGDELLLYNTSGMVVRRVEVYLPEREYTIDAKGIPPGLYMVVLNKSNKTVDKAKLLINK